MYFVMHQLFQERLLKTAGVECLKGQMLFQQCQSTEGYRCTFAQFNNILICVIVGDRPYRCELCGVSFTQKNNLTRHMQIHGGRFRYKCSYDTCNFATRRYESFKQHMVQHGPMPYQCRLCDKSYFFTQVCFHHCCFSFTYYL